MDNVTLLFDLNNLAFRTFFTKEVGITAANPDYGLWKFITFDNIYKALSRVENVSEVILAVDHSNPWRRVFFPRYKESRSLTRHKRPEINWPELYRRLDELAGEIQSYIPFKVIKISRAEADDVIAILCHSYPGKKFEIISNDEDYLQLKSDNVNIYHPGQKKHLECEDVEDFLVRKCLTGQSKDDIFNVKTPDYWGLTPDTKGKRKPGLGPKTASKIIKEGYENWLKSNGLLKNYQRNRRLIDFKHIPKSIKDLTIKSYENYAMPDPKNMYIFFKENNFRWYIDNFTQVENRLLQLYGN